MTDTPLQLAGDFDQASQSDWEREILKLLNRRRPEGRELNLDQAMKSLRTNTIDGLTIEPFYQDTDEPLGYPGVMPYTRGATIKSGAMLAWDVSQLHEDPDVATTNTAALRDLQRGATSLWLRLDPDAIAATDLAKALDGVMADLAPVSVSSHSDQDAAANALAEWWRASNTPEDCRGNLGIDPIAFAARNGGRADLSGLADWAKLTAEEFPQARALTVDVLHLHNAGASDVQELAYAIATGVEYLRALTDAGMDAGVACDQILFRVSATSDQFSTIARLRALRRLWGKVTEVIGVEEPKRGAIQHAVTSWRMMSREDPYVNLLRGTIASFSAALGGAESITVLPFDTVHGLPGQFSSRLARNTQLVAMEESNIGRVSDPAGGSTYVEEHTADLAQAAWSLFQEIEKAGGMVEALASSQVADQLAASVEERAKRLATRKQPITGVSMYPLKNESPIDAAPRPEAPAYGGLAVHRDAEIYEAVRDRASTAATGKGAPTVLLARLGSRRDFGAREGFTSNVLLAGGIKIARSEEGATPEEIVEQVQSAHTPMVILCSSGKVYAAEALDVAKTLKDAGVQRVFLAGNLKETRAENPEEYIDGTVFDGMNVVEFLESTLKLLGV